ncbi:uncharacterized protein ACN63O_008758 [Diretmus argenteus]
MTLNTSDLWGPSLNTSSPQCAYNLTGWEQRMDQLYTYFYLLLFIPGLLLNTVALWVLCRHISKKTKAVIFMINLALADLAHVLSLPLRIYYYFTHTWPFGHTICLLCFYLKYLNMYASIVFLVCISVQRCVFLLKPFSARQWRRRYDLLISITLWVVVGLACTPFILMRSSSSTTSTSVSARANTNHGVTYPFHATSTQGPIANTKLYASLLYTSPTFRPVSSPSPPKVGCFKDLPTRRLPLPLVLSMMGLAELFGFLLPLAAISYSSFRICRSLNQRQNQDQQNTQAALNSSARHHLRSASSSACQTDKPLDKQTNGEKRRALRLVLSCSALFLVCFAPYHLNFMLYLMVSQDIVVHCATRLAVRQFHPVSLCLASLSCCLNPLLYYFVTAEFRLHLTRRTSSFNSSLISSPITSPTQRHAVPPERLMSMDSMSIANHSCGNSEDLRSYQHRVYAVVYGVILAPGLLGNVLALWVFRVYVKETKKAVVFMMNLAVADLMQVLSLPLRIYYYVNHTWPFGHPLCMMCFYLKYVNMYASIFFLVCVSVRRCELIIRPLRYNSSKRKGDVCICAIGWLLVCLGCLPFPLLRNPQYEHNPPFRSEATVSPAPSSSPAPGSELVCFSELPMRTISAPGAWALLVTAELVGFVLPLVLVLACTCLTAGSLRNLTSGAVHDQGEKRKALRMVLSCAVVFLVCFAPYHVTMPLDFLAKANSLSSCTVRELVLRFHPVTLCLASLNSTLDPLMYYFTTDEFKRRLSRQELPVSLALSRRLSCITTVSDHQESVEK